jgi:hypothetical protein
MIGDTYNRDGEPIPNDWWNHPEHQRSGATEKRVAATQVEDVWVSTVWLQGIDHAFPPGRGPLIFETMVFGGTHNQDLQRYVTEEEAMRGHLAVLDRLRAGKPPFAYLDEDAS